MNEWMDGWTTSRVPFPRYMESICWKTTQIHNILEREREKDIRPQINRLCPHLRMAIAYPGMITVFSTWLCLQLFETTNHKDTSDYEQVSKSPTWPISNGSIVRCLSSMLTAPSCNFWRAVRGFLNKNRQVDLETDCDSRRLSAFFLDR